MSTPIPPRALNAALAHVRAGCRLFVATHTRVTIIDSKTLARWERAGMPILREEGDGYRMATGRTSVYLFPGQLRCECFRVVVLGDADHEATQRECISRLTTRHLSH